MSDSIINIVQGATLRLRVRVRSKTSGQPVDLTGTTITSQIRNTYAAAATVGEFAIETEDLANGVFVMALGEVASEAIPSGRHVFDVRIEFADGSIKKHPRGQLNVLPGVTR